MDSETEKELTEFAFKAVFEFNMNSQFVEISNFRRALGEGNYRDLYSGLTKMGFREVIKLEKNFFKMKNSPSLKYFFACLDE